MKGAEIVSSKNMDLFVDLYVRGEEREFFRRLFALDKKRAVYVAARIAAHLMDDQEEASKFILALGNWRIN
jgi:hypothetical protein